MPIPASTASMAISIVNGLVRLTGRVDRIMAEHAALRGDLAIPGKPLLKPPLAGVMKQKLQGLLDETQGQVPDPLADKRAEIAALVAERNPGEPQLLGFMQLFLPDEVEFRLDDPNGEFIAKLKEKRETWDLDDADILRAAYFLQPGEDLRKASTPWQIAMTVVDVLTDMAIENQSLVLRNDRARPLLLAILQRFADTDLATVGSHRVFLRVVLKTTVNGALDAADTLGHDKLWVDSVLEALADTREAEGDDFVVGLLNGRSYPVLLGNLLEEGADIVAAGRKDNARRFESIAVDVFKRAASLVKQRDDFKGFVNDHWGELLRAGLKGFHANGDAILGDQSPLLRGTLLSAIEVLAETPDREFLSGETLTTAVEAAIAAVAVKPDLLDGVAEKTLLKQLIGSTAAVVADKGIHQAISSAGVETVIQDTMDYLAQRPELLLRKPGLAREVVGSLLGSLAESGSLRLESVAVAGVNTLFNEIAANPELLDTSYPQVVAEIAGKLGAALGDLRITRDETREMLVSLAGAVAVRSALVTGDNTSLPAQVLEEVLVVLGENRGKLLSSTSIRGIAVTVLDVVVADTRLLAGSHDLVRKSVAAVLDEINKTLRNGDAGPGLRFDSLAMTALDSVLVSLAANPSLLTRNAEYAMAVGQLSAVLAGAVDGGQLHAGEVEQILLRAAPIIAANAQLLANGEDEIVAEVAAALLARLAEGGGVSLRGDALAELLSGTLKVLAAHRKSLRVAGEPVEMLVERVRVTVGAGLDKAREKLGQALEQADIAPVVVELLRRWARDQLPSLDVNVEGFNLVFDDIVAKVTGQLV